MFIRVLLWDVGIDLRGCLRDLLWLISHPLFLIKFFFFFLNPGLLNLGVMGAKRTKERAEERGREGRKGRYSERGESMTWKQNEVCHAHGGWCEECTEQRLRRRRNAKKKKKNCLRKEGARGKMRINAVTERWHNFASSALEDVRSAGAQLCWPTSCWAVWVAAALHLCRFRPEKPEDIQAYSKRVPAKGKMGCHLSPKSLVLFQLPARLELSEKSELIVTLWVAFRVGLKKMTTWVFWGGFYSCWTGNQRGK